MLILPNSEFILSSFSLTQTYPVILQIKMSDKKQYYKSKSKSEVIQCRVCQETCLAQNYQGHLKSKHPDEDQRDLRRHGEVRLNLWGGRSSQVNIFLIPLFQITRNTIVISSEIIFLICFYFFPGSRAY